MSRVREFEDDEDDEEEEEKEEEEEEEEVAGSWRRFDYTLAPAARLASD